MLTEGHSLKSVARCSLLVFPLPERKRKKCVNRIPAIALLCGFQDFFLRATSNEQPATIYSEGYPSVFLIFILSQSWPLSINNTLYLISGHLVYRIAYIVCRIAQYAQQNWGSHLRYLSHFCEAAIANEVVPCTEFMISLGHQNSLFISFNSQN